MPSIASVGARAPLPTVVAFGSVGVPVAALVMITTIYLPRYCVELGLSFMAVVAAITTVRAIDIAFDPLISLLMDRTKTPIGRYRPWLILGAPVMMLATRMLLAPQVTMTPAYLIVWLLVVYAGLSMVTLGLAAWAAVLATSYHDRARVYGLVQGLAAVGSVSILVLPPLFSRGQVVLGKASSMPIISGILIVLIPVTLLICTVFTPEKAPPSVKREHFSIRAIVAAISHPAALRVVAADLLLALGPGACAPLFVYFFHDAKKFDQVDVNLLLVFGIAAMVVGAPFWGWIAQRLNKHRTVQVAALCFSVSQAILTFLPERQFILNAAGMFTVGFSMSAFIPLVRAMIADVTDVVKLDYNRDLTSLLFSMVTTVEKIGNSVTVLVVFPILAVVGYNGKVGAINTPHAIFGLEMCFLLVPIAFVAAGAVLLAGYKLDPERHAEVRAALDAREAAIALEEIALPDGDGAVQT